MQHLKSTRFQKQRTIEIRLGMMEIVAEKEEHQSNLFTLNAEFMTFGVFWVKSSSTAQLSV